MALDFRYLTSDQILELMEVTEEDIMSGLLLDLHCARADHNTQEVENALENILEYLMMEFK